jgi:hypothetical protein
MKNEHWVEQVRATAVIVEEFQAVSGSSMFIPRLL